MSSLLMVITAVALAHLADQGRRLSSTLKGVVLLHAVPLFIAPPVLVGALVLSAPISVGFTQSRLFTGAMGYLFHVFICYMILSRVFRWSTIHASLRRQMINLKGISEARCRALRFLRLAPPLVFTFSAAVVLQESMVSTPFYSGRTTAIYATLKILKSAFGDSMWMRLALVTIILSAIAAILFLPALFVSRVGRCVVAIAIKTRPQKARYHHDVKRLGIKTIGTTVALGVAILSCAFVVSVVAIAAFGIWKEIRGGTGPIIDTTTKSILLTLVAGPGTIVGFIGSVGFATYWLIPWWIRVAARRVVTRWKPFTHLLYWMRRQYGLSHVVKGRTIISLAPTSVAAVLIMPIVVGKLSLLIIGYAILLVYAVAMNEFFSNSATWVGRGGAIDNASMSLFTLRKRLTILLTTEWGSLLIPALLATYCLWVEDGVQGMIFYSRASLVYNIWGMVLSSLKASTYSGVMIAFLIWTSLFGIATVATSMRHAWVRRHLG